MKIGIGKNPWYEKLHRLANPYRFQDTANFVGVLLVEIGPHPNLQIKIPMVSPCHLLIERLNLGMLDCPPRQRPMASL
jgi:hypothetical protein